MNSPSGGGGGSRVDLSLQHLDRCFTAGQSILFFFFCPLLLALPAAAGTCCAVSSMAIHEPPSLVLSPPSLHPSPCPPPVPQPAVGTRRNTTGIGLEVKVPAVLARRRPPPTPLSLPHSPGGEGPASWLVGAVQTDRLGTHRQQSPHPVFSPPRSAPPVTGHSPSSHWSSRRGPLDSLTRTFAWP